MNIKLKIINSFLDRLIPQIYKGIRNIIAAYLYNTKILYLRAVIKMPINTDICEYIMRYNFIEKYITGKFVMGYDFDIYYILEIYLRRYIIFDIIDYVKLLCIYDPENKYKLFDLLLENYKYEKAEIKKYILNSGHKYYIRVLRKKNYLV